MITKKELKTIRSLGSKKNRKIHQQYVVEGEKTILSLLEAGSLPIAIYTTKIVEGLDSILVSNKDMERMSLLKSASHVLAIFSIPQQRALPKSGRILVLDEIADPGNLGTLIRLCDWFGIAHIVCSENTVDWFNPKVVQASMGSIGRVQGHYCNLSTYFTQNKLPVFGAFLSGQSIYSTTFPVDALLVLGSESHGISAIIEAVVDQKITIPKKSQQGPESLNVATAAAIILGEFCQ